MIEVLKEGRCDGILPAARGFVDGFAEFLLRAGILDSFKTFPDRRARRSIPVFFFCHSLVYCPLFELKRLAPIERALFRSPYILRKMGLNAPQIEEGFYNTQGGSGPSRPGDLVAQRFLGLVGDESHKLVNDLLLEAVGDPPDEVNLNQAHCFRDLLQAGGSSNS